MFYKSKLSTAKSHDHVTIDTLCITIYILLYDNVIAHLNDIIGMLQSTVVYISCLIYLELLRKHICREYGPVVNCYWSSQGIILWVLIIYTFIIDIIDIHIYYA